MSDFYEGTIYNDPYYGTFVLNQLSVYIKQNETDGSIYREFEEY